MTAPSSFVGGIEGNKKKEKKREAMAEHKKPPLWSVVLAFEAPPPPTPTEVPVLCRRCRLGEVPGAQGLAVA